MGRGRSRAAAAVALVMASMGPAAPAAAQPDASPITVTWLIAPDGAGRAFADHINEAGLITGKAWPQPEGPFSVGRAVVWQRDSASYVGPQETGQETTVLDVSERGQVVGTLLSLVGSVGFSWSDGVFHPIVDAPPGSEPDETSSFFLTASAVNEQGQVLGMRVRPPWLESPFIEAAVWQDGAFVASAGRVDTAASSPRAIDLSDRGRAVINVRDADGGTWVAALWQLGDGLTRLGTLGGRQSRAAAIDDRGRVAGVSETASGDEHAFLWRGGRMVDLGTLGGATSFVGESLPDPEWDFYDVDDAVNERGEVVGTSETASGDEHAFLWRRGRMIDLGTLGGASSHATAVNDHGQVVGFSETLSGEQHAFLWQDGEMIDLGALAGGGSSEALDINDRGQVVGRVGDRAVRWTAPPVRR